MSTLEKKKRIRNYKYVEISCAHCGKQKEIRSYSVKNKNYCDPRCSQLDRLKDPTKHPSWKGGKRISHAGYIEIHNKFHHRARKNGYVFEHILVAEKKIGRELTIDEHVHHINRNKQDNRPENLEVLTASEHALRHTRQRTGKYLNCVVCGQVFYRKPSHVKRAKCCSIQCVGRYTNLKIKGVISV